MVSGVDNLVLTKSDVLNGFDDVKIFYLGEYHSLPGWSSTESDEFEMFVQTIESFTKLPISIISFGQGRNDIRQR